MNRLDQPQPTFFLIVLVVIALLINATREFTWNNPPAVPNPTIAPVSSSIPQPTATPSRPEPEPGVAPGRHRTQEEEAARRAEEAATRHAEDMARQAEEAAIHARYLARYLKAGFTRNPAIQTAAIAVVSDDGKFNGSLDAALAGHFRSKTLRAISSFFTPSFISDGLFASTFAGSTEALTKLDLTNSVDVLLLARQTVQYSTNASLDNLITANMQLEVMTLPVTATGEGRTWSFTANGAGFKQEDARSMAEARLIKQITTDTNLLLTPVSPDRQ